MECPPLLLHSAFPSWPLKRGFSFQRDQKPMAETTIKVPKEPKSSMATPMPNVFVMFSPSHLHLYFLERKLTRSKAVSRTA